MLCRAVAVVIPDLVCVRVLSVYLTTCVSIDLCWVLDSLISKNATSPFFSFFRENMIPSVVLLMVSKTCMWCVFIMALSGVFYSHEYNCKQLVAAG